MITATNIYLWGIFGRVEVVLILTSAGLGIAAGFAAMAKVIEDSDTARAVLPKLVAGFVASVLLTVFVPSRETFAAIYVLPAIAKSEAVQKDLPEVYNMAIDFMKKQLTKETK